MRRIIFSVLALIWWMSCLFAVSLSAEVSLWKEALRQKEEWYKSDEAKQIANNVIAYQNQDGGWLKNLDNLKPYDAKRVDQIRGTGSSESFSTFDNGATWNELLFLMRVYSHRPENNIGQSIRKGVQLILKSQYDNGGWPQIPGFKKGKYNSQITFNDGAMIGVMRVVRKVVESSGIVGNLLSPFKESSKVALKKGLDCILKSQVVVKGKKTLWAAQHDKITLAPVWARKFEPPSLAVSESAGILRFLINLRNPDDRVKEAIDSGIQWLKEHKITGYRIDRPLVVKDGNKYDDRVLVHSENSDPLWARFYEIGTNRPIFCGRNSEICYSLTEVEIERRAGYSWYGTWGNSLIEKYYPRWKKAND